MKLHFNVLDVNEHKPIFETDDDNEIYIKENLSVGDVVVKLKATDADTNSKVFFLFILYFCKKTIVIAN